MERTFSMIKPRAVAQNAVEEINAMIEAAGLKIIAKKRLQMTPEQAGAFYAEHTGKPFYEGLVEMMSSGPIIVQVLEGEDVIKRYRTLMGATNPEKADKGTIRAKFGESMTHNAVHGSDSPTSAAREIAFFFDAKELDAHPLQPIVQEILSAQNNQR